MPSLPQLLLTLKFLKLAEKEISTITYTLYYNLIKRTRELVKFNLVIIVKTCESVKIWLLYPSLLYLKIKAKFKVSCIKIKCNNYKDNKRD
jgi:hypothetical protein